VKVDYYEDEELMRGLGVESPDHYYMIYLDNRNMALVDEHGEIFYQDWLH
jgi:hypothetical protein